LIGPSFLEGAFCAPDVEGLSRGGLPQFLNLAADASHWEASAIVLRRSAALANLRFSDAHPASKKRCRIFYTRYAARLCACSQIDSAFVQR
jgi:hypothetical protein